MAQEHSEGHPKPDETVLQEAGDLKVLDESGKETPFRDLFNTEGRQVIVFIRHFFCGVSRHRLAEMLSSLTGLNSTVKTTCAS